VLLRQGRVLASGVTEQTLTPANIRALYDVEADVHFHDGAGRLTVVPIRRAR
jgi:ABC-type cobalamin/Fe3+-siderophores transport system ATPase subunit